MSSDPNTPDFDSMSPEEMMEWMESLAKRQGADASGFTTEAKMDVAEIDPDTVDEEILNQKYIPDGWSEEKWEAHLAKEEAEKEARLATQQGEPSAEPESIIEDEPEPQSDPEQESPEEAEPEPEPIEAVGAPIASDNATPDFDSMSPEEMMAWMETLAKRQGADEGFTTAADMEVAEVDPDTVDEAILNQKYIPGNMSEAEWERYLEKEEQKKAEKLAEQRSEPESIADLLDEDELDEEDEQLFDMPTLEMEEDEQLFDLPTLEMEEETEAVADNNPMAWLENLATTDEDSEELDLPDLSGLGDDLSGLTDLVQEDDSGDPLDWLASLAGDGDEDDSALDLDFEDMSAGLEGLEAFALTDEEELDDEEEDESIVSLVDVEDTDPETFLESLARLQGADEDELSTDASTPIPDFLNFDEDETDEEIEELIYEDIHEDILEDTQPSEELEPAWDIEDPNSIENPEAWLDALANNAGGSTGQMDLFDDDEEDYDEDEELLVMQDEEDGTPDKVIEALNSGKDVAPEDIQGFFESMFDIANTEHAHLDNVPAEDEPEDGDVSEAVAIDMPDWLQELNAGTDAEASEVDEIVEIVEDEGEDLMADVLAGLEEEPEDLPDILGEVDDDVAEAIELPDWLTEGAEGDTGDVIADIIADELDVPPGETAVISVGDKQIEVDPNDTWTQAFLMEDREDTAEEWYTQRLNEIDMDDAVGDTLPDPEPEIDEYATVQMTNPPGTTSLEPATFPVEEDLPEGQIETAPEWLTGMVSEAVSDMPLEFSAMSVDDDDVVEMPDWLNESIDDDIEIPDWLTEAEEETDTEIPDWLADAGVEEATEIPDWLTDTVEEPVDFILSEPDPEPEPAPAIQPVQMVQVQAPPPAENVTEAIRSAQEKVSNDDLDAALSDYEAVVRANDSLDVVVSDLQKLTKNDKHKKNPAVYRVLGDAMMRNGDLQDALDVYRRALNLL